jgi:hypothetical protein
VCVCGYMWWYSQVPTPYYPSDDVTILAGYFSAYLCDMGDIEAGAAAGWEPVFFRPIFQKCHRLTAVSVYC